jgi:hypothetical protein
MLDPNRYSLDAATVGFRTRMGLPVNWSQFDQALQTQSESIKVRRELKETPISEVHVMGGERYGLAGNSKTNELARQARQMNGYPLRSFYATGGAIVLPAKHGEGLLATPQNVGLTSYAQYNGVVGNLVSSFTEPLNAPLDSGTMLFARAGVQAKSESITNPYKYLQFMLNMNATQEQIQANEQQHRDLRGYNRENSFAMGENDVAAAAAMRQHGAGRAPGSGTGIANHLPNINSPWGVQYGQGVEFGYMQPNEPENVTGNPARGPAATAPTLPGMDPAIIDAMQNAFADKLKNRWQSDLSEDDRRQVNDMILNMSPPLYRSLKKLSLQIEKNAGAGNLIYMGSRKHNLMRHVLEMMYASFPNMQQFQSFMGAMEVEAQQEEAAELAMHGEENLGDRPGIGEEAMAITHFSGLEGAMTVEMAVAEELVRNNDGLIAVEKAIVEQALNAQKRDTLANGMEIQDGNNISPPSTLDPLINEDLAQKKSEKKKRKKIVQEYSVIPRSPDENKRNDLSQMIRQSDASTLMLQESVTPSRTMLTVPVQEGEGVEEMTVLPKKTTVPMTSFQAARLQIEALGPKGSPQKETPRGVAEIQYSTAGSEQGWFNPTTIEGKIVVEEAAEILNSKYGQVVPSKDLYKFIQARKKKGLEFADNVTNKQIAVAYAKEKGYSSLTSKKPKN